MEATDFIDVRSCVEQLNLTLPDSIVVLPYNLDDVSDVSDLLYAGSAPAVIKLLRTNDRVDVAAITDEPILTRRDHDVTIVLPTLFFAAAYLSQNPHACSKAVADIASPNLEFPYFRLMPTTLWDRIGERFRSVKEILGKHRLIRRPLSDHSSAASIAEIFDTKTVLEVGNGFLLMCGNDDRPLERCNASELVTTVRNVYLTVCSNVLSDASVTADST